MGVDEFLQEEAAEEARQHPHGQEEALATGDPAPTVRREPATGYDAVDMGVMGERRAPGMQNGDQAQPCAQSLGVGSDGLQGLGGGLEQQVIDHGLVLEGDGGDLGRQGEDDMEIGRGQQVRLAFRQPDLGRRTLTLRAMAVAAGVVTHR